MECFLAALGLHIPILPVAINFLRIKFVDNIRNESGNYYIKYDGGPKLNGHSRELSDSEELYLASLLRRIRAMLKRVENKAQSEWLFTLSDIDLLDTFDETPDEEIKRWYKIWGLSKEEQDQVSLIWAFMLDREKAGKDIRTGLDKDSKNK